MYDMCKYMRIDYRQNFLYLVLVHVDVTLDIVIAANLVEFGIGESVLLDEEHQFVNFLLLVKKVHVGRLAGEMESFRHA